MNVRSFLKKAGLHLDIGRTDKGVSKKWYATASCMIMSDSRYPDSLSSVCGFRLCVEPVGRPVAANLVGHGPTY